CSTARTGFAAAGTATGAKPHVALSVVGTERLQDLAYFRAKLMQEKMIKGSPVPHTIIRASLFFEWIRPIAQAGTDGDTVRVSHSLFHPAAADDVASAVADVAL